jgi:hypothetical protein
MSGKIQVSIDHRTQLGKHYSFAERGNATVIQKPTRCFLRKDCNAEIGAGEAAVIWFFERLNIHSAVVGVLCNRCDAEMVEVAEGAQVIA